jgi:hypothetical protein
MTSFNTIIAAYYYNMAKDFYKTSYDNMFLGQQFFFCM